MIMEKFYWRNIYLEEKCKLLLADKVLGAIELRPNRKFYDYEAKYNPKAKTEHIIPVQMLKSKYQEVTNIALKAHKILKCRGVTRSDFRYYKNSFYLLETNTQPGMTSLSLVPEIAKFNNITFKNLIKKFWKMLQLINKKKYISTLFHFFITTLNNHNLIKDFEDTFKIKEIKIENTKKKLIV